MLVFCEQHVLFSVGLNDKIADGAFDAVANAYREATGKRWFKPKRGEKTEIACREFMRLQFLLKTSTTALMSEAIDMYGGEWCQETFGSKFPPFTVVVGEKCRKRLIHAHKPVMAVTQADLLRQAKEIADNLVTIMGVDDALVIVNEGWPPQEHLRNAIKTAIQVR